MTSSSPHIGRLYRVHESTASRWVSIGRLAR
jgi:hypothetical protein